MSNQKAIGVGTQFLRKIKRRALEREKPNEELIHELDLWLESLGDDNHEVFPTEVDMTIGIMEAFIDTWTKDGSKE